MIVNHFKMRSDIQARFAARRGGRCTPAQRPRFVSFFLLLASPKQSPRQNNTTQSYHLGGMGCGNGVVAIGLIRDLLQARPGCNAIFVPAEITSYCFYGGSEKKRMVPNVSVFARFVAAAAVRISRRSSAAARISCRSSARRAHFPPPQS
jgi:hypothetical protein